MKCNDFDYVTGEFLKCAIGDNNHVEVEFEDGEFKGYHVASTTNQKGVSIMTIKLTDSVAEYSCRKNPQLLKSVKKSKKG